MDRIIVDYKKLTPEILQLVVEKYPFGYDEADTIKFKNAKGESVEALEIKTLDTIFLVKVGVKLNNAMEKFSEEEFDTEIDFSEDDF